MPFGESFDPNEAMPHWTEIIDGVEVLVQHGLDFSKLTFPDGTWSLHHDDGRVTTFHADGAMDVIDPLDDYARHHSAAELDIDAIAIESALKRAFDADKPEAEK